MKRPIRPVSEYREHEAYPSSDEEWVSRRDFLRRAVAASAASAVGAVALTGAARAAPAKKDQRERVVLYLDRWQRIGKSSMRAEKLVIFTRDKKLAEWLRHYTEQRKVRDAVMKQVRKAKEDVLYDGKKLYRLERRLGAVVAEQYRKHKKKGTAHPDVMLTVSPYYYRHLGGLIAPPSRPYRPHP